jgi:serine/threonine-protein kinase
MSIPHHPADTASRISAASDSDETSAYHTPTGEAVEPALPGERYRVLGVIARGGMGIVWRAHDLSLDRPLAIKALLPIQTPQPDDEWRFLEEAAITGQLQHPGIPPVHEVGRLSDGRPFFSMKLIQGRTLGELLQERLTPQADLPRFLKIFEQIAQTLAYAHAQGIIHRDLKPLNIMVGAFGEVQVMDWGLAKRRQRDQQAAAAPRAAGLEDTDRLCAAPRHVADAATRRPDNEDSHTQAGQVLGTFAYMAPEQARAEVDALDERCDVFGLGAILCVILTGRPPYQGRDRGEVLERARSADLAQAHSHLDCCGADSVWWT